MHIRIVRLDNQWSGLLGVVLNLNRPTVSANLIIDCRNGRFGCPQHHPRPKQSDLQGSKLQNMMNKKSPHTSEKKEVLNKTVPTKSPALTGENLQGESTGACKYCKEEAGMIRARAPNRILHKSTLAMSDFSNQ